MREPLEREYFETRVRPNLGWGMEYLGEVSHDEKVDLLQNARVTLFPIEWEEPFGLVMIESMACGTPVVATRFGAVPEVIDHGRSGLIVDDVAEMVSAIERPTRSTHSNAAATSRSVSRRSVWSRTTWRPTRRCSRDTKGPSRRALRNRRGQERYAAASP